MDVQTTWPVDQTHHAVGGNKQPEKELIEKFIEQLTKEQPRTFLHGFEPEFSCSHCSQLFSRPVTGPCGYSFCSDCAAELPFCDHCDKYHEPESFSKMNTTLNNVLECCYPNECSMRSLTGEGEKLLKEDSFREAEAKFTEVLAQNPYDIYILFARALARKRSGDWKGALEDVISAKIRDDFIPESFKENGKDDFAKVASQEATVVQETLTEFLEVVSEGLGISSSTEQLDNEKTVPELKSALDSMLSRRMTNFVTHCNEQESEKPEKSKRCIPVDSEDFDDLEFSCALCASPFYDPVCTPCGHTFCLDCLERCFDHGNTCPMCKRSLDDIYQYQKCLLPIDQSINTIIRKHLPELFEEREQARNEKRERLRQTLPVFVCTVAFPGVNCMLHVFEPRYRLMIRRATRVHGGNFGIAIGSNTAPFNQVGTVTNIESVAFYQDGRSLVTSKGTKRFEVEEYHTCDGYNTAKVKYIVDEDDENEEMAKDTQLMAKEVYDSVKQWFSSTAERFQYVTDAQYGSFPAQDETKGENGPHWPWWVLAMFPVKNDIKTYVLGKKSFRARLILIKLILQKFEDRNEENEET